MYISIAEEKFFSKQMSVDLIFKFPITNLLRLLNTMSQIKYISVLILKYGRYLPPVLLF